MKELDSHSIRLIGCEGDKGRGCTGITCSDTMSDEVFESEFDSHIIGFFCDGERGTIFLVCLDQKMPFVKALTVNSNGEESELGLCKAGDLVCNCTGVTDLLAELDSGSE